MLELLDLDLRLLQFRSGNLILLPLAAPILQSRFTHFLESKRPCPHLLVAYLIFHGHLAVVLPAGQTVPDDLYALLLRRLPSLLHVASSS